MRRLHRSIPATSLLATLTLAATAISAPAEPVSLWDHNTSVMALHADGASRALRYQEPRVGLQQEGVVSGTLLFSGTKTGNTYSGTAYIFSRRCGARPYPVTGTVAADERTITLRGTAPATFDATCRPIRYRDDVLVFSFLRLISPPPLVAGSIHHAPTTEDTALKEARAAKVLEEQRLRDLREQREKEERRLAELRAFTEARAACQKYSIEACDTALRSPHVTRQDAADLSTWRAVAHKYRVDLDSCRTGSVTGCDAALASPAVTDQHRPQIEEWRSAASPFNRAWAFISTHAAMVATILVDAVTSVRNLPASTQIAGGIAAFLALALVAIAVRSRKAPAAVGPQMEAADQTRPDIATSQSKAPLNEVSPHAPGWRQRLSGNLGRWFSPTSHPAASNRPQESDLQSPPPTTRDTPGAIAALELAHAYIEEVRAANWPAFDEDDIRKHHLNTLALASKQLDAAQKLDPDAMLEGLDERDIPYRFTINELKAQALILEGTTHQTYDTKRAIPALRRATALDPNNPSAFYILGLVHAANMNRTEAVAALQRAVDLDPANIAYRKELNRTQSLSASEIAAYKATRAGERIFDAGIKTANAGIMAWNIFAFVWNVVTFPLRVVVGIFRFLGLTGFR